MVVLVENALQAYQLAISDDDCGLFVVCTGFQHDDLPLMPSIH
jgi:hypothetical protein